MIFENLKTRRDFLRYGCRTMATLGAASAFGQAGRLAAQTSGLTDYKALVCIFLFGGSDANNMLVPNESTGPLSSHLRYSYQNYATVRQGLALAQNTLAAIHDSATCVAFGLHPSLAPLAGLYNATPGRLAPAGQRRHHGAAGAARLHQYDPAKSLQGQPCR